MFCCMNTCVLHCGHDLLFRAVPKTDKNARMSRRRATRIRTSDVRTSKGGGGESSNNRSRQPAYIGDWFDITQSVSQFSRSVSQSVTVTIMYIQHGKGALNCALLVDVVLAWNFPAPQSHTYAHSASLPWGADAACTATMRLKGAQRRTGRAPKRVARRRRGRGRGGQGRPGG